MSHHHYHHHHHHHHHQIRLHHHQQHYSNKKYASHTELYTGYLENENYNLEENFVSERQM